MTSDHIALMGTREIAVRLGEISRQRVHRLIGRATFPAPVAELNQGRVWLAEEVEAWIAAYRPPGPCGRMWAGT
ncbi:DNA-binding protein [Actinoplanes sp. NPDC023936]|uniref:helix-turn-helix transcriptional regulator n=1 Tax=Actinoplanes sp. NPDC023936 TaxID=3154910 RepID=UPI0033D06279